METGRNKDAFEGRCQVLHNIEKWPYARRCSGEASHEIVPHERRRADGIEYICDDCAQRFRDAFGEETTRLLPGFYYVDSTGE